MTTHDIRTDQVCAASFVGLGLALVLAVAASAQEPAALVPRAELFRTPAKSIVRLAPDGDEVAWIERVDGTTRLMRRIRGAADVPFAEPAIGVGQTDRLRDFVFADGGGYLVVIADATNVPGVWLVSPDGADRVRVTPPGMHARQVVRQKAGDALELVVATAPTESFDGTLYRLTAGSGDTSAEPQRLARRRDVRRFFVDADLQLRAAMLVRNSGGGLVRFDGAGPDGEEWTPLARYSWDESRGSAALSLLADGKELYAVCAAGRDRSALVAYDLETGEGTELATDPLADWVPAGATIDPVTGKVRAVVSYFGSLRRHLLEPDLARDFALLASAIAGDVSFVEASRDDATWLVRRMNGGPLRYYVHERSSGRTTPLFTDMPWLDDRRLASRRTWVVPTRDGVALPIQVYLPPGRDGDGDGVPDEPLPAVFYVHGGPWVGFEWNSWFTNRSFQLLANRGYAVVRCEFRGAGGYGQAFLDRSNHEWGAAMHDDIVDISEFAIRNGIAARDRMAVWGWSFGGYRALTCLTHSPGRFACALSMYGLADLLGFTQALYEQNASTNWLTRVGDVRSEAGRELLRAHSPLFAAERVSEPLFITHGALDARAPKSQSDAMVRELRKHGKDVLYTVYPGERHDYRRASSWVSYWAIAEHFLARHLGGRAEPFGSAFAQADFEIVCGAELVEGLDAAVSRR